MSGHNEPDIQDEHRDTADMEPSLGRRRAARISGVGRWGASATLRAMWAGHERRCPSAPPQGSEVLLRCGMHDLMSVVFSLLDAIGNVPSPITLCAAMWSGTFRMPGGLLLRRRERAERFWFIVAGCTCLWVIVGAAAAAILWVNFIRQSQP